MQKDCYGMVSFQSGIILGNQPLLSRTSIQQWQMKTWWDEKKEATGENQYSNYVCR